MIVREKIPKELEIIMRRKIQWMRNLFENHSKRDMKRVSQFKILSAIHHPHFHRKAKVKVFTKYCPLNIGNKRGLLKRNRKNLGVTARDLNV